MGKPFDNELIQLKSTYEWACSLDISAPANAIRNSYHLPLLSVGSGGSFSAAELHATLHRIFFQSVALALTPMELISALPRNRKASVWFTSASGNNIDIRRSFQHAILLEPRVVSALVGRKGSKLAKIAAQYQYTNLFEYPLPTGKDGFLATNSLLAFSIILYRTYSCVTDMEEKLPPSLDELLLSTISDFVSVEHLNTIMDELWKQKTIHVIYSPRLKSIAIDIESKFIEAGLGSIHLADLRNFAHGRHHWFSKNACGSGILCLTTSSEKELGYKTLDLLPKIIPKCHIDLSDRSGLELVTGIVLSLHFTSWRGKELNIDPGRPQVPSYGSKIYHLTKNPGFISSMLDEEAAINRKTAYGPVYDSNSVIWKKSYRNFIKKMSNKNFGGLILDYDGTLVDSRYRSSPPAKELCIELIRLLEGGLKIGFATGRGKSIREALQNPEVIPEKYWNQILIGYYNGSDISQLSDNSAPDKESSPEQELKGIVNLLSQNLLVSSLEPEFTQRKKQITVESKVPIPETFLWETVQDQLSYYPELSVNVVRSSHSIDILLSSVSKLAVLKRMYTNLHNEQEILVVGDRGRWPGNDTSFLSTEYSLSVDEVSFAQDRCWNLCPAGVRGPQGTLGYLKRMTSYNNIMHFN